MDLNALKLLVEIIESGNLSAAARRLNTTRSNVSHRLKAFEQEVGVQLLRRTTRRIEPTEVGYALYEHGARMVREMEAATEVVTTLGKSQRGHVRISVPTGLGQFTIAPLLLEFARRYPEISLRVVFNNRVLDLMESEVDIALRITSDPPQSYVARELMQVDWVLCAAPVYLRGKPLPRQPDDLPGHAFVSTPSPGGKLSLPLRRQGKEQTVMVTLRLQAESFVFLRDAALAGLGVALLPRYAVREDLAKRRLVALLPEYVVDVLGNRLYLITLPNRLPTQAVRSLIEFLKERLQDAAE